MINDKTILITCGTGTLGTALIKFLLRHYNPKVIRTFSRDETKQYLLYNEIKEYEPSLEETFIKLM